MGLDNNSVIGGILPLSHIFGIVFFLINFPSIKIKSIIYPHFDFIKLLQGIEKYRITNVSVVPPIATLFAKHSSVLKYDLSSLQGIGCGAAPLRKEVQDAVYNRIKVNIRQAFGMTEIPGATACTRYDAPTVFGSCGFLVPNVEAKVITEDGRELGVNEIGELCFRCPNMMTSYLNRPDENIIDSDGFLHTGDVGYVNENGYWFVVGRSKEIIKTNGFQVPPAEIETLLLTHPAVQDAAVIGKPDATAGEIPVAFISLKQQENKESKDNNAEIKQISTKEILEWTNKQIETPYKLLRGITIIDQIPRSPAGKILRRILLDKL